MTTEYCRQMLRVVVAQICQHLGWHSTNSTPLEVLTDVTERYILDVSKLTHQYAEQYGRTKVNLNDLGLAFRTMDISISELEDYIKHVDAFPFEKELVVFPKPKKTKLGFPNPKSREIYHREEHIPHYLPYMFPGMEDEVEAEEEVSPPPSETPAAQAGNTTPVSLPNSQEAKTSESLSETSPNLRPGEKRLLNSPTDGQVYKRQRLTNNNLPEEAGHSQYEMTGVKMLPSGLLSPMKNEGKLPDASLPQIFTPVEKKKEPVVKEIPKKIVAGVTGDGSKLEDKENITVKKTNSNQKDPGKVNPTKTPAKSISKNSSNLPPNKTVKKNSIAKGKITKITKKSANRTVVAAKSLKGKVMNKNSVKNVSNKSSAKNVSNKNSSKTDGAPPGSPGSCLKELLLHPKAEKSKTTKVDKKLPYSSSPSIKAGGTPVKVPSNLLMPANAMAMSKNLHSLPEDDSSTDESPEPRLIIAESDPKPKEKGDSKWGKSAKYDSIQGGGKKGEQSAQDKSKAGTTSTGPKEKKTAAQKKKKEPVKRSTSESIDACINTVVRNYSAAATRERKQRELDAIPKTDADALVAAATAAVVSAAAAATASSAALNSTAVSKPCVKSENLEVVKKGDKKPQKKKKNVTKEKVKKLKAKTVDELNDKENAEVPDKLKEKLQQNVQHQNSPGPDRTPLACPDRYASEAWKIYDFDGSPPVSRCCSSPTQGTSSLSVSPSPKQMSPTVMDSLTLLSTAATSAANAAMGMLPSTPFMPTDSSNMSMQDTDLSQLKMKIGLKKGGKGKIKSKLKSKIKEHKKEKKDKKKDKEKKKKTKEREEKKQKDKERIKEDNYQCTVVPQDGQISTPLSVPRLKLNIKLGSSTPVAVASDEGSNKPAPPPVSLSITERSPSNAAKREPPQSPSLSRPEIPRLVIRTPMPPTVTTPPAVLSPPMVHPEKAEKNLKPEKPTPKTKPAAKKKAVVKKPAVKKADKKVVKKGPKMAAYPLDKRGSFSPPMMPSEFPEQDKLLSGSKQMMYPNVGEMHPLIMKPEKQVPVKPMMRAADRVMMPTSLDKTAMNMAGRALFKEEMGFTKVSNISPRTTAKAGRGKGTKGSKANKPVVTKTEKLPAKVKSERVASKTKTPSKAEKAPMTKVPVTAADIVVASRTPVTRVTPTAKMPIMKPEKAILTKEKPIMKINRPPNRLGRPPKVEVPSSPPPTIPYPSSPSHKSHLSTLPIAHPLTHPFNPLLPSVSTPIANMSRPSSIPVPTPISKLHTPPVPKVQPTPKVTQKSHTGRGGKTGRPSRSASKNLQNSKTSGMSAITSFKETLTDSIRAQPENLLTPPLLPSPLTQEQFLKAENPAFNTGQMTTSVQIAGASTLDHGPFMLPLDAKGSTMVMEPSESSVLLGKRTVQRSVFAETVGTFFDENGQKVWICPGCALPDDGSPMIGCDDCDEWYHWPCVNIKEAPPEQDQWFCPKCLLKTKHKPKRKRKRRTY
ncbi:transcription initiation factor TFIID subunit 3 [Octopus bimaculoides]|uniref:PHD-type domain-containing protein n=1 Tax=Octopus bimaculoides TaxID=37653 RepID=A0A0L8GS53_OCTBM|nr:transcription initiation factor TFIID subunit 3 [Octopus bimaculoides]XP_014778659.1 transcription initiation factor TFIID subunit 3 [Octopus bimaculoides]XP_014778660.1 transcription initiation factor TFIID subunit 3 [Octopus bimaculoides]XP_052821603.1 transcription initiation factor TFIID subunit 3 [Octopus bimaculoides]XP_052821604.1 transcription initiation factor TFIID subunit 3 [Octopus bimaculoides]|eukprot:XP_014778658.1 PREDICTED: transcription initiation factor TFIID subunit 3-like [Octopus bimaculoides]